MLKFLKEHILFFCILFSCLILRLLPLFEYQFTLDEWSGLDRTNFTSFSELIEKGVKIDAHPAFVQVLIYYLRQWFGFSTWIIKLPFLLFSFGAVIYAYAFCLRNFSKQTALIASSIFSFSLLFVFYAPIARMYISGAFFSVALLYHFFEIFFLNNNKRIHFIFLGLFALLSALNQHVNALFALTVCASGLLFLNKNNLKPFLITCVCVIILYLPNLPVTLYQLGIGGIGFEQGGWLPVPEAGAIFDFLKALLGTGRSYLIFISLILFCFIANRQFKLSKTQIYLAVIFILNYLVIYFYSVYKAPVFQYSVMLFASVAAVLVVSSFLDFKNKYLFGFTFVSVTALLIFKSYFQKDYFHQSVKNIYEFQFQKTIEYKNKYGDKNVYPIFFDADTLMRDVYFKKYNSVFDCKLTKDSVTQSIRHFSRFVAALKSEFLILASSAPQQQAIAMDHFPYLIENIETQGSNFKVFSKTKITAIATDDSVLFYSDHSHPNAFTFDKPKNISDEPGGFSVFVDSLNEYPFAAKAKLADVSYNEGEVILVKAKLFPKQNELKGVQLCLALNDIKTDSSYYFTAGNSADCVLDKDSSLTLYTTAYLGTNYKHIKNKAKITVFFWNTNKEKFNLADLQIKTIDYWNKKWNFWK